jgi:hypothetical protein
VPILGHMTVREIIRLLRQDLPGLVRYWVITVVVVFVGMAVAGFRPWDEALAIGFGFLAMGIPVVPMLWMSPGWRGFSLLIKPGAWKAIALVFGWAVISFIPAAMLMFLVLKVTGQM